MGALILSGKSAGDLRVFFYHPKDNKATIFFTTRATAIIMIQILARYLS
ncbi:hypothetical protein [Legionella pneumophila]